MFNPPETTDEELNAYLSDVSAALKDIDNTLAVGTDWENPGTIGSAVPNTGSFTTITASGAITGSNLSGTNTGDNSANTTYAADYRAANFIAGTNYLSPAGTENVSNKRISARTGTTTSSATPTINTDNVDLYSITALAAAITSFTTNLTGTPVAGDTLIIEITDNGTARAITWGSKFEASTVALPTTTVASAKLTVGFIWNTVTSKWRCLLAA